MIIASLNGPTFSRAGFGQSTFVQGKDFNCNSSICYGIGTANHELFKQLQQAINSFAPLARFTAITVDGFIGAGTVNAGAQAARFARGQGAGDSELLAQLASGLTKEQIAADAPGLLADLTKANSTLVASGAPVQALAPAATAPATAPAPTPSESFTTKAVDFVKSFFQPSASPTPGGFGPAPATPGAPTVPGAAPTTAAAAAAAPTKKVPTWVWIFAGVAGVAIVGGVSYAIFHKPAAAPAPAAAKAPAAPAKAVGRRSRSRRRRRAAR